MSGPEGSSVSDCGLNDKNESPAFRLQHRWRTAWLSGVPRREEPCLGKRETCWNLYALHFHPSTQPSVRYPRLHHALWFLLLFSVITYYYTTQTVSNGCRSLTWKDLMKVHRRVLIPSPLLRSLTSLITLNKRKKVIEMRALSSVFWGKECKKWGEEEKSKQCSFQVNAGMKLCAVFIYYSCNRWHAFSKYWNRMPKWISTALN